MTSPAGTKRNTGSRSTNRLINHGHAMRSTRAFSRVTHFMAFSFSRSVAIDARWRSGFSIIISPVSSSRGPCRRDLFRRVAIGAEDNVRLGVGGTAKVRIHVFPDRLALSGDFEETAEGCLIDQRIPVRQPLRVTHARREEIRDRVVLIPPHDLVRCRIDLDDPRKWQRIVEAVYAVVEDENVAVRQRSGSVLACKRGKAELPDDPARCSTDANDRRDGPVADENIP